MAQQQLIQKSRYIRVQNWGNALSMCIPKVYADNLDIKIHDTVRVTQDGDVLVVRKAFEEE
jgi:antitoxin component of MazEF toxin-antitoxin module